MKMRQAKLSTCGVRRYNFIDNGNFALHTVGIASCSQWLLCPMHAADTVNAGKQRLLTLSDDTIVEPETLGWQKNACFATLRLATPSLVF